VDDALGVARSVGSRPTLIELLVRLAIDAMAVGALERSLALTQMPAAELGRLRGTLRAEMDRLSMEHAIYWERAAITHAVRETPTSELWSFFGGGPDDLGELARLYRAVPGWRATNGLLLWELTEPYLEASRLPPRERLHAAREAGRQAEAALADNYPRCWLAALLMPSLSRAFERELESETQLELAATALAVEQWRLEHGRWPDSLEDPFAESGEIRYRRTDDGVVLYGLGLDGRDQGGAGPQQVGGKGSYRRSDIAFRLLDPERRGATVASFRNEVMDSGVSLEGLAALGFGEQRLHALGFSEQDLRGLADR
jgi:hypothetical protein